MRYYCCTCGNLVKDKPLLGLFHYCMPNVTIKELQSAVKVDEGVKKYQLKEE